MAHDHPQILQLTSGGVPVRWIDYKTAVYYYAKDLIAWTGSEDMFTVYGGNNRVTGNQSSIAVNTIIATKGEVGDKSMFRVPTLTNKALFRRDQNLCAYCSNIFKNEDLTRDHIQPRSRSGPDKWQNVVTACGSCNKYKDDRTPGEADMKLLYVPYAPSRSEYLLLLNRSVLADQMAFLKARIPLTSRIHIDNLHDHVKHQLQ